jgi:hypothetical protein
MFLNILKDQVRREIFQPRSRYFHLKLLLIGRFIADDGCAFGASVPLLKSTERSACVHRRLQRRRTSSPIRQTRRHSNIQIPFESNFAALTPREHCRSLT